jgi:transcriptional regulator with XRE-family HTH domain
MPPEGSWIKFRLDLKNFKYEEVAKKARRSVTLVSQVISGKRRSNNVQAALADILGFASYEELMYYARRESKGGAA